MKKGCDCRHSQDIRLWSVHGVQTHGEGEETEQEMWNSTVHCSRGVCVYIVVPEHVFSLAI